jgi:carbamate kinase
VGAFFLKEEAELLAKVNPGWIFKEDPRKRGWRRVVASPRPIDILNRKVIKDLAHKGNIIIASGGGGIPVYRDEHNMLQGIEAVIDKDLASSLLATEIGADEFFILTDIPKVYIHFNKPNQTAIDSITVDEAKVLMEQGEFAEGSMRPKIEAAIEFVNGGGKETIITEAGMLADKNSGTRIKAITKEN